MQTEKKQDEKTFWKKLGRLFWKELSRLLQQGIFPRSQADIHCRQKPSTDDISYILKLCDLLLSWFSIKNPIIGDWIEEYREICARSGKRSATRWLYKQVAASLFPIFTLCLKVGKRVARRKIVAALLPYKEIAVSLLQSLLQFLTRSKVAVQCLLKKPDLSALTAYVTIMCLVSMVSVFNALPTDDTQLVGILLEPQEIAENEPAPQAFPTDNNEAQNQKTELSEQKSEKVKSLKQPGIKHDPEVGRPSESEPNKGSSPSLLPPLPPISKDLHESETTKGQAAVQPVIPLPDKGQTDEPVHFSIAQADYNVIRGPEGGTGKKNIMILPAATRLHLCITLENGLPGERYVVEIQNPYFETIFKVEAICSKSNSLTIVLNTWELSDKFKNLRIREPQTISPSDYKVKVNGQMQGQKD